MANVANALRNVKDVPLRQACDLSGSSIDLVGVLEKARQGLFSLVDGVGGAKCLVFDPAVAGPLKLVLVEGSNTLKNHGVVDVMELNWADLEVECETIIYIVRPKSKIALQVASQVKNSGRRYRYQLHFVPKRSFMCDQLLRNKGVWDVLKDEIYEYPLGFIPYDTDLLSLGLDAAFSQINLKSDDSPLMYSARALLQLQETLGPIKNIQVKGDQSKKVLDMMLRMRVESEEELASEALDRERDGLSGDESDSDGSVDDDIDAPTGVFADPSIQQTLKSDLDFATKHRINDGSRHGDSQASQVDTLLLIDRNLDLVTPMCTALTYESLIDSLIGIRNGHAMVDSELVESGLVQGPSLGSSRKPKVSLSLNSADHIYKDIRDMNIDVVLSYLNTKAREMKDNWQDVKGKEVEHLHNYVQNSLRHHVQESQLLPRHVNIVNRIRDTVYDLPFRKMWAVEREILEGENQLPYIEECIARQDSWNKVLRLACLQSLVGNGISSSALDSLRRSIVHTYGFELIFTLDNLERLGMLKRKQAAGSWSSLVSAFRLIQPSADPSKPEDISYVTSGYAPLSARVVQLAIRPGWENAKDMMKKLPGRTIYKVKQPGLPLPVPTSSSTDSQLGSSPTKKKNMLVFFTGGITSAEISALRFISKQDDCPFNIIISSTSIVNGKTLLQTIAHEMENRLQDS